MAIDVVLSQPLVQRLGWTLVHFVWQGAAVAALFGIVTALLRHRTANSRYVAACTALLLMAVLPVVTLHMASVPTPSVALDPDLVERPSPALPEPVPSIAPTVQIDRDASVPTASIAPPLTPTPRPPLSLRQRLSDTVEPVLHWIVCGWIVGVLVLSLRLLGGWARVQRLKRRFAQPVADRWHSVLAELTGRLKVRQRVRLLQSALAQVPTVIGWFRPIILLPATVLTGLTQQQVEALIAHELAHIRRYDYLVNLIQTVTETLLFYHPAVWWVSHRIRVERENCCDDLAVTACGDARTYACALTEMEQLRSSTARLALASSGGSLVERIRRLLPTRPSRPNHHVLWLSGLIAVAILAVLGTSLRPSRPASGATGSTSAGAEIIEAVAGGVAVAADRFARDGHMPVRTASNPTAFETWPSSRHEGMFELSRRWNAKPISVRLSAGVPEAPNSLWVRDIEFVRSGGELRARVNYVETSWPRLRWRVNVELHDANGKLLRAGEQSIRTSGNILSGAVPLEQGSFELALGPGSGASNATRFAVSIELVDDADFDYLQNEIRIQPKPAGIARPPGSFALQFDGEGDYVEVPHSPSVDLQQSFTVESWVRFEEGGTQNPRIISKGSEENGGYELLTWGTGVSRRPAFYAKGTGFHEGLARLMPRRYLLANAWYHVAVTYDGSRITLYVDGDEILSYDCTGTVEPNPFALNIGRNSENHKGRYKGAIDEVRIWNVARREEEIRRDMARKLTGKEPGLVACWPFDEGSGQVAHDISPNRLDGTLGASPEPDNADPAWPGRIALSGQAADTSGNAIAGATIVAKARMPGLGPGVGFDGPVLREIGRQITNEDGRFLFTGLPEDCPVFVLSATHPRYHVSKIEVINEPPKTSYETQLVMDPGIIMRGTVVDTRGNPVAGARVNAGGEYDKKTYTDEHGRFELAGVVGEEYVWCDAWKKGYVGTDAQVSKSEAESGEWTITLMAEDELAFSGRALFADRTPAADMKVHFVLRDQNGNRVELRDSKTDIEGRFTSVLTRPRTFSGTAWIEEAGTEHHVPHGRWQTAVRDVRPARDVVELVFENRGAIEVIVEPANELPPSRKFEISCWILATKYGLPEGVVAESTLGAKGGTTTFEELAPGKYRVEVKDKKAEGWNWSREIELPDREGNLRVVVHFPLPELHFGKLRARVLEPDGKTPLKEGKAWVETSASWATVRIKDGIIDIDEVPAGRAWLEVRIDGYTRMWVPGVIPPGETADLGDIVLVPEAEGTGWVEGRILFDDGTPVLGAAPIEDDFTREQVGADGGFRMKLPVGEGMVAVELAGAPLWPRSSAPATNDMVVMGWWWPWSLATEWNDKIYVPVDVPPDQTVTKNITVPRSALGDVRVSWLGDPDARLSLKLFVKNGDQFFACCSPLEPIRTGSEITEVPSGERTVILQAGDYCGYKEVANREQHTLFSFDPAQTGTVSGRVLGSNRTPIEKAIVELYHPAFARFGRITGLRGTMVVEPTGRVSWAKTAEDGSFQFPRVEPGQYGIRLSPPAISDECAITVEPREETAVELTATAAPSEPAPLRTVAGGTRDTDADADSESSTAGTGTSAETWTALIAALDARHASIRDLKIEYRYEGYYLPGHSGVKEGRLEPGFSDAANILWMQKGTKQYLRKEKTAKGDDRARLTEWSWDDTWVYYINHTTNEVGGGPSPTPQDEEYKPFQFFYALDWGWSWGELAKEGSLLATRTNHRGTIYRLKVPVSSGHRHYVVDFADYHSFAPVCIELYTEDSISRVYEFKEIVQTPNGFWYPRRMTKWLFAYEDATHFDPTKAGNRLEFFLDDVKINSDIPDTAFTLNIPDETHTDDTHDATVPSAASGESLWGEPANGLQCRLEPLRDDEVEEPGTVVFPSAKDMAFKVYVKNVGNRPVDLVQIPEHRAEYREPLLFRFDFFDLDGNAVERPQCVPLSVSPHVEVSTLPAGDTAVYDVHVGDWMNWSEFDLRPGTYRVRVTYVGDKVINDMNEVFRKRVPVSYWKGEAVSNLATIAIAEDQRDEDPGLVWGEPVDGLRAALELVPRQETYSLGQRVDMRLHVENVGERTVQFITSIPRQGDRVVVEDKNGNEQTVNMTRYTGISPTVRWIVPPGQVVALDGSRLGIVDNRRKADALGHPTPHVLICKPGRYFIRRLLWIPDVTSPSIPQEGDWRGTLETGARELTVVRAAESEAQPDAAAAMRDAKHEVAAVARRFLEAICDGDVERMLTLVVEYPPEWTVARWREVAQEVRREYAGDLERLTTMRETVVDGPLCAAVRIDGASGKEDTYRLIALSRQVYGGWRVFLMGESPADISLEENCEDAKELLTFGSRTAGLSKEERAQKEKEVRARLGLRHARGAEPAGQPPGEPPRTVFRGLDLTGARRGEYDDPPPDLRRNDVLTIKEPGPLARGELICVEIFYIPAKNVFYLQYYSGFSSRLPPYYGPFEGDPFDRLHIARP